MPTLYEKRGRRYVPIAEQDTNPFWTEGYWLVHVRPGLRTTRQILDPAFADVEAAFVEAEDAMAKALVEELDKVTPANSTAISLKNHEKAWALYKEAMGEEYDYVFRRPSPVDIVRAGLQVVRECIEKRQKTR